MLKVSIDGTEYTWSETHGVLGPNQLAPPLNVRNKVLAAIQDQIAERDEALDDPTKLVEHARRAKEQGQYRRAIRLATKALELNAAATNAAAVMSSSFRKIHEPELALEITSRFASSRNHAVLCTRAAAMADLERFEEAFPLADQAYAASGGKSEEVRGLYRRFESECCECVPESEEEPSLGCQFVAENPNVSR